MCAFRSGYLFFFFLFFFFTFSLTLSTFSYGCSHFAHARILTLTVVVHNSSIIIPFVGLKSDQTFPKLISCRCLPIKTSPEKSPMHRCLLPLWKSQLFQKTRRLSSIDARLLNNLRSKP
ncbi:hypothetical protein CLIB1423_32S00672 [[Candida] railenensis]|uniref:Uncharacterized protein n=1 Tax=[Candida] railenensis TaxID=45579 RepID=A0A9P0QVE1_9ASCO|nr:hypothetical protein CLIB1423_32S00672 [[Candida] railenensis]